MTSESLRGTRAAAPDLDWSLVRETVLMLGLATGQVEAAMRDSGSSVDVLTDTFTALAGTLQHIEAAIDTLPDTVGNGLVKEEIRANTRLVAAKVHQAIVAFQFYDKLAQRLDHVCHGLAGLADLVADPARLYRPAEWKSLQDGIRAKYSMAEERLMFEAVLGGMPVQEALEKYLSRCDNGKGEIELF